VIPVFTIVSQRLLTAFHITKSFRTFNAFLGVPLPKGDDWGKVYEVQRNSEFSTATAGIFKTESPTIQGVCVYSTFVFWLLSINNVSLFDVYKLLVQTQSKITHECLFYVAAMADVKFDDRMDSFQKSVKFHRKVSYYFQVFTCLVKLLSTAIFWLICSIFPCPFM